MRRRALRGGRLRPVSVRPSAWPMLGVFLGVVEAHADDAAGLDLHVWPDDVVALFGPRTRALAGLPERTPAELLAGELSGVALDGVELRVFDAEDLDGHHDHDESDDHPPPDGEALAPGLASGLQAALREPIDGERLGALLVEAAASLPPGHALAPPPDVDLEARWRVAGAIARYLERTAY